MSQIKGRIMDKKKEKELPVPAKLKELKVKEDPRLKKIQDLPPEVLAGAIRDMLNKDNR